VGLEILWQPGDGGHDNKKDLAPKPALSSPNRQKSLGGFLKGLTQPDALQGRILFVRGQKVMIDSDRAEVYNVTTKVLNQAVKRNIERFPADFMFQLTQNEKDKVVTNCDHLGKLRFSPSLPYAFTEHGAIMVAALLNSPVAIAASIHVVRAFIRLRQLLESNIELARKLSALEKKYDSQFRVVFDAIRELMTPDTSKKRKIGFRRESE
jgi:hypothetical protein